MSKKVIVNKELFGVVEYILCKGGDINTALPGFVSGSILEFYYDYYIVEGRVLLTNKRDMLDEGVNYTTLESFKQAIEDSEL